ncbi:MAG TPA: GDSL-type esterase/lipase family protein [Candidatus Binatia bacterium]
MAARRVRNIVLPLLVFAAVLGAVELAVRATLPHYSSRDFFLTLFGDPPDRTPRNQQPLFEGDPVLFWRLRPNVDRTIWDFTVVSTNEQGLRHPERIERKRPGTFRIVCLGDSVTFGYRIPLVFPDAPEQYDRDDAPYPRRLERLLRAEDPARDVEVIALAVPGYSTHQGLLLLERWIDALEPDLVIICFGFNDVSLKPSPDHVVMSRGFLPTVLRAVVSSSQALLHLWSWWANGPGAPPPGPPPRLQPRVPLERYVENIGAMVALAREHGAQVLVVGPVYRDPQTNPPEGRRMRLYRDTLRATMEASGVPYLEIAELTEAAHLGNALLFGEHIHPSSLGHQLMAERILAALRRAGLLDAPSSSAPSAAAERSSSGSALLQDVDHAHAAAAHHVAEPRARIFHLTLARLAA